MLIHHQVNIISSHSVSVDASCPKCMVNYYHECMLVVRSNLYILNMPGDDYKIK